MTASDIIPRNIKSGLKKIIYCGSKYYCPVCESRLKKFLEFGNPLRANARCPICGSLERHRLLWLYFKNETDIFSKPNKMLHFAPEVCFQDNFKSCSKLDYITADLVNPAMVQTDIMDIKFPDNSFDVIYCCHVLEHVEDDIKAMRELVRVLKPGGWALLQVPINAAQTYEDPSVTDPEERERLFGQCDHVRVYGPDYKDRLEVAGFIVNVLSYYNRFSAIEQEIFGFKTQKDDIYLCRKKLHPSC